MHAELQAVVGSYASNLLYALQTIYPRLPAKLGLPALRVTAQSVEVSPAALDFLLQEVSRWAGDHALGLTVAQSSAPLLCPALAAMAEPPTLRSALAALERAESAVHGAEYRLIERGRVATLSCRLAAQSPLLVRFHAEYVFAKLVQRFRQQLPSAATLVQRVRLQSAPPRRRARHAAVFGGPVLFGQETNALSFRAAFLDLPKTPEQLETCAHSRQASVDHRLRRLAAQVRDLIRLQSSLESVDSPQLAQQLGVTPRALRRRLAAEGTSLSELLDEERRRVACEQIVVGAPLSRILEHTGFASSNTFGRAFRRWTGLAPSEFASRRRISSHLALSLEQRV